jgi:hypothetical protein
LNGEELDVNYWIFLKYSEGYDLLYRNIEDKIHGSRAAVSMADNSHGGSPSIHSSLNYIMQVLEMSIILHLIFERPDQVGIETMT